MDLYWFFERKTRILNKYIIHVYDSVPTLTQKLFELTFWRNWVRFFRLTCSWTLMSLVYKERLTLIVWTFWQIQFIIKFWLEPQNHYFSGNMFLELASKVSLHQRKSSKVRILFCDVYNFINEQLLPSQ